MNIFILTFSCVTLSQGQDYILRSPLTKIKFDPEVQANEILQITQGHGSRNIFIIMARSNLSCFLLTLYDYNVVIKGSVSLP